MFHGKVLVLSNEEVKSDYFLLRLETPEIAKECSPGQFLHLKCSSSYSPLLRRPLSIHRVGCQGTENRKQRTGNREQKKEVVEVLYKVVGRGTGFLSQREKGEKIDVIGPLGNGFEVRNSTEESTIVLVAGGMGVAPLLFLAEKLAKSKIKNQKSKIRLFMGAKNKKEILCQQGFKELGAEVEIATDDGSLGYQGLVSDLLKNWLSTISPACRAGRYRPSTIVYTCGPKPMLREIAFLSEKHKIPCQISLEQFMGCGIGVCNACVVPTKDGYRKVCKDGPVFRAEEIDWERI